MQSKATNVKEYFSQLPDDRRTALKAVREVIFKNLDKNYEEGMSYGMIGYYVPHSIYPAGYHCDPKMPLPFAGLASQKNHMSIYLMCVYGMAGNEQEKKFRAAWAKTGKKLDMGKSCIRFKKVEDLALDVIGETIRQMPVKKWIAIYEKSLEMIRNRPTKGSPKKNTSKKPAPRSAVKRARR